MKKIRVILAEDVRVETGAIQFGDDWPGLFVRGDDAIFLAIAIDKIETFLGDHKEAVITDLGSALMTLDKIRKLIEGKVIQR